MKILYLSGGPRIATGTHAELIGAKNHVTGIINAFKRNGDEVTQFIIGDLLPKRFAASGSGNAVSASVVRRIVGDVLRMFFAIKYGLILLWRTRKKSFDIVYERSSLFNVMGLFVLKKEKWYLETNAPISYEAKNDRKTLFFYSLAKKIERIGYLKCGKIIVVTARLKKVIQDEFPGIPGEKFIVLPNAVDTTVIDPAASNPLPKRNAKFLIGCVGLLYPWVGLDLLIEAIHRTRDALNVELHIIGEGQILETLEHLVADLALDNVLFCGRIDWPKVAANIGSFDLCYSGQSKHGYGTMYGSPIKLYEYMALGKPVLASAHEDSMALITDELDGYLFEPNNLPDLIEKLKKAYTGAKKMDPKLIRSKIVASHSWENRIRALYSSEYSGTVNANA